MADNVIVDNGSLTDYDVATDAVTYSGDAARNLQLVRLVHVTGAEGSKVVSELVRLEDSAHTDADPGIPVLGVRNDADAARIGSDGEYGFQSFDAGGNANVRSRKQLVKIAVTSAGLTTAATAYTAGDQLGNQMTFAGAARASGGGGMIVGAMAISAADTIGAIDFVVARQSITLAANDAAFAISDADALFLEAYVQLANVYDIGNNRIAFANNLAIPYTCAATSLFIGMITRFAIPATPFAAATDIQLNLYVELN